MTHPVRLTLAVLAWLVIGLLTVLVIRAEAASPCENVPGFVAVQAASLRVRSGAGTTYDTLRFVGRDDILPVPGTESVSGWWRVCPEGFVSAGYVRFEAAVTPTPTATARPVVIVTQTPRATPTPVTTITPQAGCWIDARGISFFIGPRCEFIVRQVP